MNPHNLQQWADPQAALVALHRQLQLQQQEQRLASLHTLTASQHPPPASAPFPGAWPPAVAPGLGGGLWPEAPRALPPAGRPISRGDSVTSMAGSDGGAPLYSRKDKSLGVLCENFLTLCQNMPELRGEVLVSLDKAAEELGVQRRRVYDIVNVLECVEVVTRKQKNSYVWHGFSRMQRALDGLAVAPPPEEATLEAGLPKGERREKSMAVLARRFLQALLTAPEHVMSLEDTCRVLLGGGLEDDGVKTKVRRLYDIANILSSLPLIEKTHIIETRKPAFKFIGVPSAERAAPRPGMLVPPQPQGLPMSNEFVAQILAAQHRAGHKRPAPEEAHPMKRSRSTQDFIPLPGAAPPSNEYLMMLMASNMTLPTQIPPEVVYQGQTGRPPAAMLSHPLPPGTAPMQRVYPTANSNNGLASSMTLADALRCINQAGIPLAHPHQAK